MSDTVFRIVALLFVAMGWCAAELPRVECRLRSGKSELREVGKTGDCMYNGATFDDWDKFNKSLEDGKAQCAKQSWKGKASFWDALYGKWVPMSCEGWKKLADKKGIEGKS